MGDFAVEGSELKKMVKLAKKGPVSFGFNPGKSEDDAYCGMHRTKPPAQIGKEAKESGDGSKFAFGTATVAGKTISLTCERLMPGLAKRFKKYLKSQKVMLNVVIMDADGNVVESDIEEDLPDDPELEGEEAEGGEAEAEEEPPLDAAAVMKRLGALGEQIRALPPEFAGKLAGPFKQLVEFARAGELDRANAGMDKLDAALLMLDQQGGAPPVAPPLPPTATPDPQLQKLQQAADTLRTRVEGLADDKARTQLTAALDKTDAHIGALEVEAAITLLRKIGDILKGMAPGGTGDQASQTPANPDKEEWERRFAAMEPQINAALSQGLVKDVDALRKLRDWTTGMAMQGTHDKALQALPRIEAILATMVVGGPSAFEGDIAPDVQPFAKARVIWSSARAKMLSEVKSLESAIVAACAGDEMLAEVSGSVTMLTGNVVQLDERLETKMDEIVNAAAGEAREKLKGEARAMIDQYRTILEDDFFKEVDQDSGFGSFAVASTATAALSEIAVAIA